MVVLRSPDQARLLVPKDSRWLAIDDIELE